MRTLLLLFSFSTILAWKDTWITDYEKRAALRPSSDGNLSCYDLERCTLVLPMHVSARSTASYSQQVPLAIWQTWRTLEAGGVNQLKAVKSFIDHNPEYDYYLFDDAEALNFVCSFYPELTDIYQRLRLGAAKADLWRLMVLYRYGGVYVDMDSESVVPLRNIIQGSASLVSGLGLLGDFHQWVLIYTPRHPIIKTALNLAQHRLRHLLNARQGANIILTTGPGALHAATQEVFADYGCRLYDSSLARQATAANEIIALNQPAKCTKNVGIMQVFNGDYLGGRIIFKNAAVSQELDKVSRHYQKEETFQDTFQNISVAEFPDGMVQLGGCSINKGTYVRHIKGHMLPNDLYAADRKPA
jgi:hypothetical protein